MTDNGMWGRGRKIDWQQRSSLVAIHARVSVRCRSFNYRERAGVEMLSLLAHIDEKKWRGMCIWESLKLHTEAKDATEEEEKKGKGGERLFFFRIDVSLREGEPAGRPALNQMNRTADFILPIFDQTSPSSEPFSSFLTSSIVPRQRRSQRR